MPEKNAENVLTLATFLATFREINVVLKVYSNTAVGRAFLATFLARFFARVLTALRTTLSPETRKSSPPQKNAENVLTLASFLATLETNVTQIRSQFVSFNRFCTCAPHQSLKRSMLFN